MQGTTQLEVLMRHGAGLFGMLLGLLSIVWFLVSYWVFDRLRDSYVEVV